MKNKYIITTGGGLGNQIMQYALWFYLSKKNEKAELFLCKDNISGILTTDNVNSSNCIARFLGSHYKIVEKIVAIKNRLLGRKSREYSLFNYQIVDFPQWPDYKVIYSILPELRKKLRFPEDKDERNAGLKHQMKESNSVSIHVRRGDYQDSIHWRLILGDICDVDYYNSAIKVVQERVESPVFYVFSDDIEWVKENLCVPSPVYVNWNHGESAFRDLELMSCCKANIIANSTFSLSAAILNINVQPIRIAPLKWLNSYDDNLKEKYLDESWIIVNNRKPQVSIVCESPLSSKEVSCFKKQTYTDFEVISVAEVNSDTRFHVGMPKGRYIFHYQPRDMSQFQKRNFLYTWLKQIYESEKKL